jgi:hypothetical protein
MKLPKNKPQPIPMKVHKLMPALMMWPDLSMTAADADNSAAIGRTTRLYVPDFAELRLVIGTCPRLPFHPTTALILKQSLLILVIAVWVLMESFAVEKLFFISPAQFADQDRCSRSHL